MCGIGCDARGFLYLSEGLLARLCSFGNQRDFFKEGAIALEASSETINQIARPTIGCLTCDADSVVMNPAGQFAQDLGV